MTIGTAEVPDVVVVTVIGWVLSAVVGPLLERTGVRLLQLLGLVLSGIDPKRPRKPWTPEQRAAHRRKTQPPPRPPEAQSLWPAEDKDPP